ncbi:dihydrofolate reductase family protein [Arthrobacter sp. zg-Y411]|uniref:dihydrofolate reductase family protein n=1 Tax=Arthrobacter zhangbolii TaxID=2886936 RepID=UPI001D137154|nr:dihydrofolate reductase family protein [Arthrobacter zhangbolii]MCC3293491.1 dihydrofolate reductase family protein [Arthrobacter zhangbolii]
MSRAVYYASASLDGFDAAGLEPLGSEVPSPAGAVVMGAGTYARLRRQVEEDGTGAWDCPPAPVWVYTHHEFPGVDGADIMFVRGPVAEFAADIAASAGGGDIWLRGADLAGQYLRHGLLDELRLTLHPVVLGAGQPVLPSAAGRAARLLAARPSADGSVLLSYGFG